MLQLTVLLGAAITTGFSADDLTHLSDEFSDVSTLANWQRVYQTEGWGFDQLEGWDIDTSSPGRMTMMPYTSSWYNEWRGVHAYKEVTGDFVVTTNVEPRNRAGTGAPGRTYSLAGIMVRTPRTMTEGPADWTPQGQDYIFLSMGTGNAPGTYQFEVKSTINSNSQLEISPGGQRALIQVARIGSSFVVLRQLSFEVPTANDAARIPAEGFPLRFTAPLGVGGTIEWSLDGGDWTVLETFTGSGESMEIVDDTATGQPRRIYRFNDN